MSKVEDNELITMGLNLGVYTFAKFFSEGVMPTTRAFETMRDHCAAELEKQTGMPVEDLATSVQPVVDDMLKRVPR